MLASLDVETKTIILGKRRQGVVRMLCMPLRHSRDCERWHTALNIGRLFESNAPVLEWKFVVFRTDGAIAFFHTNLGTTEVSDPQVIQFNNMRRGGGDGSPRTPLSLKPAPPLTPRSSVDADDDDLETAPPHHPAPSQPDTQDAPQDAPQLIPPPPSIPPPPELPLPDKVEPRDNLLSAEGDETTEMMEATKPWAPLSCWDFLALRPDLAQKRTSNSVDTGTVQGRWFKCDGKWVDRGNAHADARLPRG